MDQKDISIARRLPTRSGAIKPIVVKFSRRVARIDLMRRNLAKSTETKEVKIFEDLSPARSMFIELMKSDSRSLSVWTKEGNILYTFHNNFYYSKVTNL